MLEDLEAHLVATIRKPPPPLEYQEFELCAALGCMPEELDDLDEETYQLYLTFAQIRSAKLSRHGL